MGDVCILKCTLSPDISTTKKLQNPAMWIFLHLYTYIYLLLVISVFILSFVNDEKTFVHFSWLCLIWFQNRKPCIQLICHEPFKCTNPSGNASFLKIGICLMMKTKGQLDTWEFFFWYFPSSATTSFSAKMPHILL